MALTLAVTRVTVGGFQVLWSGRPAGGRGVRVATQQRLPGDPAVVERGKQVYRISCRAYHGVVAATSVVEPPQIRRHAERRQR